MRRSFFITSSILILILFIISGCNKKVSLGGDEFLAYEIQLGETKDSLVEKIGVPDEKENTSLFGLDVLEYKYPKISFGLYEDKVIYISSEDNEYRTKNNVGINTKYSQLEESYPKGYLNSNNSSYIVPMNDSTLIFTLEKVRGNTEIKHVVTNINYIYDSFFPEEEKEKFKKMFRLHQPLIWYARENDLEEVKKLIKKGADPSQQIDDVEREWTALIYAANNGNLEMVNTLLEAGAGRSNEMELTVAIKNAIDEEHLEVIEVLIQQNSYLDIDYLMDQAWGSSEEIVGLIENKYNLLNGQIATSDESDVTANTSAVSEEGAESLRERLPNISIDDIQAQSDPLDIIHNNFEENITKGMLTNEIPFKIGDSFSKVLQEWGAPLGTVWIGEGHYFVYKGCLLLVKEADSVEEEKVDRIVVKGNGYSKSSILNVLGSPTNSGWDVDWWSMSYQYGDYVVYFKFFDDTAESELLDISLFSAY